MINRKSLASGIAATALVSLIGLAYAQTSSNADGANSGPTTATTPGQVDTSPSSTMQGSTPSSATPSGTSSSSTSSSSTMDSSTNASPANGESSTGNTGSTDSELAPQADRG